MVSPSNNPIVRFDGVTVARGGRRILTDIDLVVSGGETLGVSGANGSGKTTLLRTLATLTPTASGTVVLFDTPVARQHLRSIRAQISLLGHQPAALPRLTLLENVQHACRLSGLDPSRAARSLDVVGLGPALDTPAQDASFGMQRRAEIALILLREPKLLLLDEALAGLDSDAEGLFDTLIESVTSREGAVVVVSHDEATLAARCERRLNLAAGRLVPSL